MMVTFLQLLEGLPSALLVLDLLVFPVLLSANACGISMTRGRLAILLSRRSFSKAGSSESVHPCLDLAKTFEQTRE